MHKEVHANGLPGYIVPIYDPRWRLEWAEKGSNEVKGSIPFEQTDEFCDEMKIPKFKPRARYPILAEHVELIERTVGPAIKIVLSEYNFWIDCSTGEPKFVYRIYDESFPAGYLDFDIRKTDLKISIEDEAAAIYIGTGKEVSYVGITSEEIARQNRAKTEAAALAKKARRQG
jgi:hypothetical protein